MNTQEPQPNSSVSPVTQLGAMDLLKSSFEYIKANFKNVVMFFAVPAVVTLISILPFVDKSSRELLSVVSGLSIFFFQISFLIFLIEGDSATTPTKAMSKTFSKLLPYIWVSIISSAITLIGVMLFLIPGIIVGVWFTFSVYIMLDENKRGLDALVQSREYVKGNWFNIFGKSLFLGMISFVIAIVTKLVTTPFLGDNESVTNTISNLVILPLATVYTFKMYKYFKGLRGEVNVTSAGKQKAFYIVGAILGVLALAGIIFAAVAEIIPSTF